MIKIKQGNILNCDENIIVHQVNVQGVMGGGVARQLADQYKELEKDYYQVCKEDKFDYEELKGLASIPQYNDKHIANIFSQKPNLDTDYEMMERALNWVKRKAIDFKLSVAIPYGIGCGIANGDWNIVYKIIEEVFSDYDVTLYKLED